MIAFKSSLILNQYAELLVIFATYLESLHMKGDELLLQAISHNLFIVRWDSSGFCFKNIEFC